MAVIGGEGFAVGSAESAALVNEAVQAGYVGDTLGADQLIGREVGFSGEHGFDDAARFGDVADDGEARAGLLFVGKFVVDAVDAHGESVIAHGDNVYALTLGARASCQSFSGMPVRMWSEVSCHPAPMQLFSIRMLVLAEVNLIPALEFGRKLTDGACGRGA